MPPTRTRRQPQPADSTDVNPAIPRDESGQPVKTVRCTVISAREWFDNWHLHREGEAYEGTFPADADGEPILPDHVVLEEDYVAPTIDLPATKLARRGTRGGASGMPNL